MEAQQNMMFAEIHPLQNHVILELIFKHLNFQDLKSCRQVCTLWQNISLKAWRSLAVLKISQPVCPNHQEKVDLKPFLDFVQDENNKHFMRLYTKFVVYEAIDPIFWTSFGQQIKFLKLNDYKVESMTDLCKNVVDLCPNLEELHLQNLGLNVENHEPIEEFLISRMNLIREYENKNLKSLTIIEDNEDFHTSPFYHPISQLNLLFRCLSLKCLNYEGHTPNLRNFFRVIEILRKQDPNKLKLEAVNIYTQPFRNWIFPLRLVHQVLDDPGLKLTTLSLHFHGFERGSFLRKLLENHGKSLQRLCLYPSGLNTAMNPNEFLPAKLQLKNLKELVLHAGVFQNMTFLKFTPNLESLELVGGFRAAINDTGNLDMHGLSLVRLRDLKLRNSTLRKCEFSRLADWMPFVENLIISRLRNESFEIVCERWPNLVTFEIYKSFINDEGITGLDSENVKRINEQGSKGIWTPITVRRANITNLAGLRSFTMNPYSDQHSTGLRYCASAYGFKQLRQLDTLKLENYKVYCQQV